MPDLVYNLNMVDAKQLGFNHGPVELARASYGPKITERVPWLLDCGNTLVAESASRESTLRNRRSE